jgi:DNA-directed RNA polymerase subunit beta
MEFWTLFSHDAFHVIGDFARTNLLPEFSEQEDFVSKPLYERFFKKHENMLNVLLTATTYSERESKGDSQKKTKDFLNNVFFNYKYEEENHTVSTCVNWETYSQNGFLIGDDSYNKELVEFFRKLKNSRDKYQFLNGKDGYLRKHMLGRRIHYSGRATISPVPELDIEHVYLPVDAGIKWFKKESGLIKEFMKDGKNKRLSKKMIQKLENYHVEPEDIAKIEAFVYESESFSRKETAEFLNRWIKDKYLVLLNRQPSLHRHSIQAFYPKFWEHYSIGIPTIICDGFGADFDGDTMAFYLPVSQLSEDRQVKEAIREELKRMLPTRNPFRLGDRNSAWSNSQDFAFGQFLSDNGEKKGKDEFNNRVFEISQQDDFRETLNRYKNNVVNRASEGDLSISYFDVCEPIGSEFEGPFLKLFKASGARGKDEQFNQLNGVIDILEGKQNFSKGLGLSDYICTKVSDDLLNEKHPVALRSRDNLMEKKLSVALAGYFTRKLVSFLYSYVVKSDDCGTENGIVLEKEIYEKILKSSDKKFNLKRFILGRYVKVDDASKWRLVDEKRFAVIAQGWEKIVIRSPVSCKCENGVCAKCYGADIAKPVIDENALPVVKTFVGLSSGHVLGEFGTQLSMKTFQTGKSFTPDALSRLFFSRRFDDKKKKSKDEKYIVDYFDYLNKIASQKAGDNSLFDSIGTVSVHLEILFRNLVANDIVTESSMKQAFKNFKEKGILTSLSFESAKQVLKKDITKAILNDMDAENEDIVKQLNDGIQETSPSVKYMFAHSLLKDVTVNGTNTESEA